jgi:phenylacetate-CoA ligase
VLEILDVDSAEPVAAGQPGDIVVTCLFKDDVYPIIRFNTHDVTTELEGVSSLGLNLRRISGFAGRSDNMVKLKGINVFPDGIGTLLVGLPGLTGEYQCRLVDGADHTTHMHIHVEVDEPKEREVTDALSDRIKQRFGIRVRVIGERPGDLTAATGIEERQKPRRLRDDRRNPG